jgi:nucleotide-binding universal stress UspA family protein
LAADGGASLIVVGSSHRSGLGRVHPGSVTESVLAGSPVPVAVAPRDYAKHGGDLRRIGCGFDGSSESREALEWAISAARGRQAQVVALSVHSPVAFGGVSTASRLGYRSANDALRAGLEAKLQQAVESLDAGTSVTGRMLDGDPVTLLRDASAELDLMVLGSRGYGPVRTLLLGSVSRALVRDAACPVMVLPRSRAGRHPQT